MVQQQLVDIIFNGLTFDYFRLNIICENPRDLESAIQVAMREQNVGQRLNIKEGIVTNTSSKQNDDHIHTSSFDTTTPF